MCSNGIAETFGHGVPFVSVGTCILHEGDAFSFRNNHISGNFVECSSLLKFEKCDTSLFVAGDTSKLDVTVETERLGRALSHIDLDPTSTCVAHSPFSSKI